MTASRSRPRDLDEYIAFMRRIVRGAGLRVADADPDQLRELVDLRTDLDAAIAAAVAGLRSSGATWDDIGQAIGTSRQAAWERWGKAGRETPPPTI